VSIDLAQLLPAKRDYFTYMGSLTTPPCSEGVTWIVIKQPLAVSAEQIGVFGHLYKNNARPVQSANSRLIKQSR
jgi:carbonic anhydrase